MPRSICFRISARQLKRHFANRFVDTRLVKRFFTARPRVMGSKQNASPHDNSAMRAARLHAARVWGGSVLGVVYPSHS